MGGATDALLRRMEPLAELAGPLHEPLLRAIAQPGELGDLLTTETDTHAAWGVAFDPDTAPVELLAWLAQWNGVRFPPSAGETEQRDRILQGAGIARGKTSSLVAEIKRTLIGAQIVRVIERAGGDQFAQTIVTRPSETPDAAVTAAAAGRQKPAGVIQTMVTSDAPLWDEATLTWDAAAAVTWDAVVVGDV